MIGTRELGLTILVLLSVRSCDYKVKAAQTATTCPVLTRITGETTTLRGDLSMADGGITFKSALKRSPIQDSQLPEVHVRRIAGGRAGDGRALRYEVRGPCESEAACHRRDGMQKVHHHVLFSDPQYGERMRQFGSLTARFSVRVLELGPSWTIIAQLWQGAPHAPPLALVARRLDGRLALRFSGRNDATGSSPSAHPVTLKQVEGLNFDEWYDVAIQIDRPAQPRSASLMTVGRAGEALAATGPADASPEVMIGYSQNGCPYANQCTVAKPTGLLDFSIGIYRPASKETAVVDFDDIEVLGGALSACLKP